jgi:aminopeptidase N
MRIRTAPPLASAAFLAFAAVLTFAAAAPQTETDPPTYQLNVRLEPAKGTIDVTVEIQSASASTFSLSRDLTIRRTLADGKSVTYHENPSASPETSRELTVEASAPNRLVIEYGGAIRPESYPPILSQVNMIRRELVELAGYVGWYPRLNPSRPFRFRLVADVPAGFVTVANGRLVGQEQQEGDRARTVWESDEPASDIALVSAPGLHRTAASREGVSVELYAARLPQPYLDSMTSDVGNAVETLSRIIRAPSPSNLIRVVYSPRPGWGYVRKPLIIVSEEGALATRSQKFGPARDLRYIAHEVAHYWWHLADVDTPEDWINEGLSEYTAWLASRKLVGQEFSDLLLEEYRERSANSATTVAIAETENASPDREVNRYARPVLILEEAGRKYGDERMMRFLQSLYRRFSDDGHATTAAFLDEAERRLGPEAKEHFSQALFRKDWRDAEQW